MQSPFTVLIVGAGTGGLCLAHGLKQAGIPVRVFERDRTRRDGLQGYRVGISPAGSYALQQCLPPELFQLFVDTCARAPRYFNMLNEQMKELGSLDVPDTGDPVDSEKSVSRMTLRQVLLTGLLLSNKVMHGISLVMAPKGMGAILHVMEFPWRHNGLEYSAGGNDAVLLEQWPGLLYDNTCDHIIWGTWASRKNYPRDPAKLRKPSNSQ